MNKKLKNKIQILGFILTLILGSILNINFVFALADDFSTSNKVLTNHQDFDVLLLDFVIPDNNSKEDVLNAITLKSEGSISFEAISKLNLWTDLGAKDFQGMTIDKKIGSFIWNQNIGGWIIFDLNTKIPVGGLRVFVSADLKSISNSSEWLRLRPHSNTDINSNGKYDQGDYGMYVESQNNLTKVKVNTYNEVTISKKNDFLGPKIFITNVYEDSKIGYGETYFLMGIAKDRQNSGIGEIKIRIDENGNEGVWQDVKTSLPNFDNIFSWEFEWKNIKKDVLYNVMLQAKDTRGNLTQNLTKNIMFVSEAQKPVEQNSQSQSNINNSPLPNQTQNTKQVSIEKSKIFVNRDLALRTPFEDNDIYVKVKLVDDNNNPIAQKQVTIHAERPGKLIKMSLITNEEGESFWTINSTVNNIFTFKLVFDVDKELIQKPTIKFIDASLQGELIKGDKSDAVYLLKDGKRFVFPTLAIYNSYYKNFDNIKVIPNSDLAKYPLGKNITFIPGSLIKVPSLSKVYRVNENAELNWIETEEKARDMYGPAWASKVKDISDSFFMDYVIKE